MRTEVTCVARVSTGLNYYNAIERLELTSSRDAEKQREGAEGGKERGERKGVAWVKES